jgi:hypothetical protein
MPFARCRLLRAAVLLALLLWSPLLAAYSMKIVASFPKGSAGEKTPTTLPANTKITPCSSTSQVDAVTFTLTYDATGSSKTVDRDVYVIVYNPESTQRYFTIQKKGANVGPTVTPRLNVTELNINRGVDMYLKIAANPGGAITEPLFGGYFPLDGLANGTWQLIGIVADSTRISFDDPSTWDAWDVATVMLGKPWAGESNSACK